MSQTRPTTMRNALENAKVLPSVINTKLARTCMRVLQGDAGVIKMGKGWNASLSFATAKKLKEEGILI